MRLPTFDSLADAYTSSIRELLEHGEEVPSVRDPLSVASNFGQADRPYLELLGHGFEVRDPLTALLDSPAWQPRLDYCFGLLSWSLSGSDDVSILAYYHPAATRFSDDGAHLSGAFGHRLFKHDAGNQIEVLLARLRADPASRRAIGVVVDPRDNFRESREFPCATSVQFFVRNGALYAVTHMRAQQALFVLPYDAFLFMSLQAAVASELGVKLGSYRHFASTFHIYLDELSLAKTVLASPVLSVKLGEPQQRLGALTDLLRSWEARLRSAALAGDKSTLAGLAADVDSLSSNSLLGQAARVFFLKAAYSANAPELADRITDGLGFAESLLALRS